MPDVRGTAGLIEVRHEARDNDLLLSLRLFLALKTFPNILAGSTLGQISHKHVGSIRK